MRRWWLVVVLAIGCAAAHAQPVRVASKKFTESVILGDVITGLVRAGGFDADHRAELGGSGLVFAALRSGRIDVYPEYTGTLSQELLAGSGVEDLAGIRRVLAEQGLGVSEPLGFSNNYAIAVRAETASRLGLRTISDLAAHPELRLGFNHEFLERADGWIGLRDLYGLGHDTPAGLDHDLAYQALEERRIDAMEVYTTEARIQRLGLVMLDDDLGYFTDYAAVLVYRLDLDERVPGVLDSIAAMEGAISGDAMRGMNAQAEIEGLREPRIASVFLRERFGLSEDQTRLGAGASGAEIAGVRPGEILGHALDHLRLSMIALLGGVLAGVPMGVLAVKLPRSGVVMLGVAGVIQTIPSLALLALMVPVLGIGELPAVVALYLYSLLPIVRGTHTGLTGVPGSILESADALGMTAWQRLRLVELPLAAPAMLAGIKTAAVMIVGFATLGALIGAGGLGVPILSGIRRDDTAMILAGAIPAASLAVLTQAVFAWVDRALVPRGLRNS